MFTAENQCYIRFILLLIRGGGELLRKVVTKELEKRNVTLDAFLNSAKAQIKTCTYFTKKQVDFLFGKSEPPDLSKWDISLLSYFALKFCTVKNSLEYVAVTKIRDMRNDFYAHYPDASLDIQTYSQLTCDLHLVISTLSHGFSENERRHMHELIQNAVNAKIDIQSVVEEIRVSSQSDEFSEAVSKRLQELMQSTAQIVKAVNECNQGISELRKEIEEMKTLMEKNGQSTAIVNTVYGTVRLTALQQKTVDTAAKVLLTASRDTIEKISSSEVSSAVREKVGNYIQDIEKCGVEVNSVEEGSVVFIMTCSSLTALLDLIDYFGSEHSQVLLNDVANALEDELGHKVELTAAIITEELQNVVQKLKNKECIRTVQFAMSCSGIEGLQHALETFEYGVTLNSLNDLSKALSKEVGKTVTLQTSVDLDKMREAIKSTKESLGTSKQTDQSGAVGHTETTPYSMKLDMKYSFSTKPELELTDEIYSNIHSRLIQDFEHWPEYQAGFDELKCVHIKDVTFDEEKKLFCVQFSVYTDQELDQFYKISERQKKMQNILSSHLTKYVKEKKTLSRIGIGSDLDLLLNVSLKKETYFLGKSHFSKNDDDEESNSSDESASISGPSDSKSNSPEKCLAQIDRSKAKTEESDIKSSTDNVPGVSVMKEKVNIQPLEIINLETIASVIPSIPQIDENVSDIGSKPIEAILDNNLLESQDSEPSHHEAMKKETEANIKSSTNSETVDTDLESRVDETSVEFKMHNEKDDKEQHEQRKEPGALDIEDSESEHSLKLEIKMHESKDKEGQQEHENISGVKGYSDIKKNRASDILTGQCASQKLHISAQDQDVKVINECKHGLQSTKTLHIAERLKQDVAAMQGKGSVADEKYVMAGSDSVQSLDYSSQQHLHERWHHNKPDSHLEMVKKDENLDMVEHRFAVHIQHENPSVSLHIKGDIDKIIEMNLHSDIMYEGFVSLPANIKPDTPYEYKISYQRTKFYVYKKLKEETESFTIGKSTFHTDMQQKTVPFEYLNIHLCDIIFCTDCNNRYEEKDLCEQIEQVCLGHNEKYKQKVQLINILKEKVSTQREYFLLAIAIANLQEKATENLVRKTINNECAQNILVALSERSVDCLPGHLQQKMMVICKQLTEIEYGDRWCPLAYLQACYPFYGDKNFFQCLYSSVSVDRKELAPKHLDTKEMSKSICEKLFEKSIDSDPENICRRSLTLILRNIPMPSAIYVYDKLKFNGEDLSDDEQYLQIVMKETATYVVNTSIREATIKHRDLAELLHAAKIVCKRGSSVGTDFCEAFEKAILDMLSAENLRVKSDISEEIRAVLKETVCFTKMYQQEKLLCTVVEADNEITYNLFSDLFEVEEFGGAYAKLSTSVYEKWLIAGRIFRKQMPEEYLPSILQRFCKMQKIIEVNKRNDVHSIVKGIVKRKLQSLPPKEILKMVVPVQTLCESNDEVMTLFKSQVQEHLKGLGMDPFEICRLICGPEKELLLDYRITADIVVTMMDHFLQKQTGKPDPEYFFTLTQHVRFIKLIDSAKGKYQDILKDNKTFKQALECIKTTTKQYKRHEVNQNFVKLLAHTKHRENVKKLMQFVDPTIKGIEEELCTYFDNLKKTTKCILNVLEVLKNKKQKLGGITALQKKTTEIQNRLENGKILAMECHAENIAKLWGTHKDLPHICKDLEFIIRSEVFWNLTLKDVDKYFHEKMQSEEYSKVETVISVRNLFEEVSEEEEETTCDFALPYLHLLRDNGKQLYQKGWFRLEENDDILMNEVMEMFREAEVMEEIHLAEQCLDRPIKPLVKGTLEKLWKLKEVEAKVKAMTSVLNFFCCQMKGDDSFQQAVVLFDQLIKGNMSAYKFKNVQHTLETVFERANVISDENVLILLELQKSSYLIEYLISIATTDIRTLIDAVEHISEQHVQKATVSAFIEVKRFLYPLLDRNVLVEKGSSWFFETFNKQVDALGEDAKAMASKINDCRNNVHNLKSLCRSAINRGEQTKEIIKNIIKKSKFAFNLNKEGKYICFEASYKQNNEKKIKSEATLIDCRSRALLLMNTERKSEIRSFDRTEFQAFIDAVDLCTDIKDILSQLFLSGHVRYTQIRIAKGIKELKDYKDNLENDLQTWLEDLKTERKQFYLLNFISGRQIPVLHDYLEGIGEDNVVQTILKFIHPEMVTDNLHKSNQKQFTENRRMLQSIGTSLHYAHQCYGSFKREIHQTIEYIQQITDIVQEGQVRVVNLESNSNLIIKTVLSLYVNTTKNLPEASQMLFCSKGTTWSEINLLLERCVGASAYYKYLPLFCIANVEKLRREIQDQLVEAVDNLAEKTVLLAIVCQGSENLFRAKLSEQMETVRPLTDEEISSILQSHQPNVFTYSSDVAGLGKTTSICNEAMKLGSTPRTLHISGQFQKGKVIEQLRQLKLRDFHVLHLDIGTVHNFTELDVFLFELIVLKYVSEDAATFYLTTEHVSIEIGNTINDTLRNSLHTTTSFKRVHLESNVLERFLPSQELNSSTQVVCHYLNGLEKSTVDKIEIHFTGKQKIQALSANTCRTLLQKYIPITNETSFNNIHIFLNVLSEQLKKLSISAFFRNAHIQDMVDRTSVPTIRSTLVRAMITVALEFSSRSVKAVRSTQVSTLKAESKELKSDNVGTAEKLVNRVECMIRWEDSNHLIFVFHNQNIQTLTPMYRDLSKVEEHVQKMFRNQMNKPLVNFNDMKQEQLQDMLQKIARKKARRLSHATLMDLAKDYALTPDNLLKMVLIMMRIQAKVPVILMGETGCGKTSLIRYLSQICEVQFTVMNIHAGVDSDSIVQEVEKEHYACCLSYTTERWLFLDEINTSQSIGLISDIICHHFCNGKLLAPNLIIMGACNPYKLRTEGCTRTAGLEGKIKTDELSKLVYRVLPLPETMVDYVWDFGSLSEKDEEKYVQKMIGDIFEENTKEHVLLKKLLAFSQSFVRDTEKSTFSVSLRDIYRCKTLVKWFTDILPKKNEDQNLQPEDLQMRAIILALAHCFHSRFSEKGDRRKYRLVLESVFVSQGYNYKEDDIHTVIKEEQSDILKRMEIPPGIARNTALQENVFMLLVCILNKIPIFLVGKPGCSKSLAMQVIRNNIRGKDSKDSFFKMLPQLYCISFQGSESSTSEGIMMVFEKAENYQKAYAADGVLSVVILDEIGLAEISGFNPLKVLHNLLEPDGKSRPNVAVVGISNWALDASKMNRAIYLSRPDMDTEELIETGISICESFSLTTKRKRGLSGEMLGKTLNPDDIREDLNYVAKAYSSYTKTLKYKNFHGLRDYYSLVKFITRTLAEDNSTITDINKANVIMKGLQRNFGGLPKEKPTLLHHFKECFRGTAPEQSSTYDLVVSNIKDSTARHLMLITKGESVLAIVESILRDTKREKREIIFGSHFEDDLTDDYNYRILSRIILCMEQGIVLILKDLEKIYGSLYDMLNQNYSQIETKNLCRVALGPYSNPFCHVAESFRCIVLVDEKKLDYTDPPFLNRFEKQFLSYGSMMNEEEESCLRELENWLDKFSTIEGRSFTKEDIFPIYNEEMLVSLVIYISKQHDTDKAQVILNCIEELLWLVRPEAVIRLSHAVDAEIQCQSEQMKEKYFELPLQNGIDELVEYQIKYLTNSEMLSYMTVVFTNSNIHTRFEEYFSSWKTQFEKVQTFKSEKDLSSSIQKFWHDKDCEILFLQCSAVEDERHVMLTKTIVERYGMEFKETISAETKKLVYLVIHLDGSDISANSVSQINYLSGWKLLMIDTLERSSISLRSLCSMDLLSIIKDKRPLSACLKGELFWAFTKIRYGSYGRDHKSISEILAKMNDPKYDFLSILDDRIWSDIHDKYRGEKNTNWQLQVACDVNALSTSVHFVKALEWFILNVIKCPLAKIIFKLESLGAIDSYFIEDDFSDSRRRLWEYIFRTEQLFSIAEIQDEFGPWCYTCERPDLLLVMPFSFVIYENIEATREDFLDEIPRLRAKCGIDADDALPNEVTNELVNQQQNYILKKIPDLQEFEYDQMKFDYVQDFCNLVSYTNCTSLDSETRIHFMKCIIMQNINVESDCCDIFAHVHCTFWANASLFGSVLQLLESCVGVFQEKQIILQMFENTIQRMDRNLNDTGAVNNTLPNADNESETMDEESFQSTKRNQVTVNVEQFHRLISLVCSKVLPTSTYLKQSNSPRQWQLKVRNVMTVAAEVSQEPKRLHALRFCDDIATYFIFPLSQPMSKMQYIGTLLVDEELDSETVFKEILAITESVKCDKVISEHQIDTQKQRVLSQYLMRCITADPETTAYVFFFQLIKSGCIADKTIGLFKAPLRCLFVLESTYNTPAFDDLVKPFTDSFSSAEMRLFTSNTVGSPFLSGLNECLTYTLDKKPNCSFNILVVDLMQEIYNEKETADYSGFLLQCGTILQTDYSGLKFIAALSLLKAIIEEIGRMVSDDKIQNQTALLTSLNATYTGIKQKDIGKTLMTFFLKSIAVNSHLYAVIRYHEYLKEKCNSLDAVNWTTGYLRVCFDMNPLSVFVQEHSSKESLLTSDNVTEHTRNNLKYLEELSKKSAKGLLFLFSLTLREFYLKRFYDSLSDTQQKKLSILHENVTNGQLTKYTKRYLSCILGKSNFKVVMFQHGVQTTSKQYFVISFLMSLFSLELANHEFKGNKGSSLFSKCLTQPESIMECFLPGFPDTTEQTHFPFTTDPFNIPKAFASCTKCSLRFACKEENAEYKCLVCKQDLETDYCSKAPTRSSASQSRAGFFNFRNFRNEQFQVRSLSPVTCNVLYLMLKGSLLGSVGIGFSVLNTILKGTPEMESYKEVHLWEDVLLHWSNLARLLNFDDYSVAVFLNALMLKGESHLFQHESKMQSVKDRHAWEAELDKMIRSMVFDRCSVVIQHIQKCDKPYQKYKCNTELQIREADDVSVLTVEQHKKLLPSLFRLAAKPSKSDFMFQLQPVQKDYPFLVLVLSYEHNLYLPKHIYNIIQWHLFSVVHTSYSMKSYECSKLSVQDFLDKIQGMNNRESIKKRFDAFKSTWSYLIKVLDGNEILPPLQPINTQNMLTDCLILGENSTMFKVLSHLVNIQNEFIDRSLSLCFECGNLYFLSKDIESQGMAVIKNMPITETRREHFVDMKFDWNKTFMNEAYSALTYGEGRRVHYEFCSIEKELIADLLVGKAYLNVSVLPQIVFTDQLYRNYVSLVHEIHISVQQEPLPYSVVTAVMKNNEDNRSMAKDLISYLDMVMTLLRKMKCDPQMPLVDFAADRSNILGRPLPRNCLPNPDSCIKVCHVVSLHELLEELCADPLIDGLEVAYCVPLDDSDVKECFENMPKQSLDTAEIILRTLKRFVYRCMSMKEVKPEQQLIKYLSDQSFWPTGVLKNDTLNIGEQTQKIEKVIPTNILVCHVQYVVELLSERIEKHKQGDQRMDEVITDWKSTTAKTDVSSKAKKKKILQLRKT